MSSNWDECVTGPNYVEKPVQGEQNGFYMIRDIGDPEIETLWEEIKDLTDGGELGHYSGISNDRDAIGVHFRYPQIEQEQWSILRRILRLGVCIRNITLYHRIEANNLSNTFIDSETFDTINEVTTIYGEVITRDMFRAEPSRYIGLKIESNEALPQLEEESPEEFS